MGLPLWRATVDDEAGAAGADVQLRWRMNALPTNIDVAKARLPATYEQAKIALASCERVDECKDWADKAEALATYAKMADDDSLRIMADRIQARAVRRMSELLNQWPTGQGGDRQSAKFKSEGNHDLKTRKQVAFEAGLSENQYKDVLAVGKIQDEKFEAAIESDNPPTITSLVKMSRPVPEGFTRATHLIGTVKRFAEFCQDNDAALVAGGGAP
jgi:hypothetical protein